eukprot:902300-Amphidinium_carterae.1
MPLTRKGSSTFAVERFVDWLRSLGHRRMILQSDGEPAILALKQDSAGGPRSVAGCGTHPTRKWGGGTPEQRSG